MSEEQLHSEEVDQEEEEEEAARDLKRIYKFRYGVRPKKESPFEALLDYAAVDFDHKALQGVKVEIDKPVEYVEEHTLLVIKPSAMASKNDIRKRIFEEGYSVLKEKTLWLESEYMAEFYSEHYGKPWFPKFILKMISGPIHIMVLGKYNAIEDLKILMGNKRVSVARREAPYSLRAMYGLRGDSATNGLHGSNSPEDAQREIRFFFPQAIPEPMPEVMEFIDYIQENMYDSVLQGIMELKIEKPEMPISWLSDWFLHNSKETPCLEPENLMKMLG